MPQQKGRFRVVDGFSRIVRLGEGMSASGRLSDAAMERALEALKICADKLVGHNITRHRLIATEACRQAENGEAFLDRVRGMTGMKLEIINRETEAYLAAEGCGALIDRKADAAVLFDIGGGSSELILVRRGSHKAPISDQVAAWTSLPIGVVTLAERFGGRDVDPARFEAMVGYVRERIEQFSEREALGRIWQRGRVHLLGTSGTVTTLAGIHLGLKRYERRLVDGLWMRSTEIDTTLQQLLGMDFHGRAASPCIGHERADLVMPGCAILEAIRRTWPCERLRVADRGLREGVLTQLMAADNAWLPAKPGRWRRNYRR
ncbi:MAG: Ppx/GppA family phosphatase [Nitratireductor sp.]|nr:Ppx/GppA family phosphatase [Nitratireductor sp.]